MNSSAFFFGLACVSCVVAAVVSLRKDRRHNCLRMLRVAILIYVGVIYGIACAAMLGYVESFAWLKNGMLTSISVFFVSLLFIFDGIYDLVYGSEKWNQN